MVVAEVFVASIDAADVLKFWAGYRPAAGCEQGPDDAMAEDHQSHHGAQAFRNHFVPAGVADLLQHDFSTEFLDVVGGSACTVFGFRLTAQRTNLGRQFRGAESGRRRG